MKAIPARRDGGLVGAASLFSAAVGYVVLTVAARSLHPTSLNATFLTFWSLLFAGFGVLTGLSLETTRSLAEVTLAGGRAPASGARVVLVAVAAGLGVSALVAGTAAWWAPRMLGADHGALVVTLCLGAVGFAVHTVLAGALGGQGRWPTYALVVAAESAVRLVLVIAVAVAGGGLVALAAAAAAAELAWVGVVLASPAARGALCARADCAPAVFARRAASASVGTAASAALVVGFPVLLSATSEPALYAAAAPLVLAVSMTRAPLMIPLNAFQGMALAHVVRNQDRAVHAVAPIVGLAVAVGATASLLAWSLGPPLMRLAFGPGYGLPGPLLAALTMAAGLLALLTLTGAACQALRLHPWFLAGWLVAVAGAVLVLLLPMSVEARAVGALSAGPVAGAVLHVAGLLVRERRRAGAGRVGHDPEDEEAR